MAKTVVVCTLQAGYDLTSASVWLLKSTAPKFLPKIGESWRKGLIYQYRYTDIKGKWQTIYSSDLKELREKEKEIQRQLDDGIDYAAGILLISNWSMLYPMIHKSGLP